MMWRRGEGPGVLAGGLTWVRESGFLPLGTEIEAGGEGVHQQRRGGGKDTET